MCELLQFSLGNYSILVFTASFKKKNNSEVVLVGGQYSSLSNTHNPIDVPRYNAFVQEETNLCLLSFSRKPQDSDMASPELHYLQLSVSQERSRGKLKPSDPLP